MCNAYWATGHWAGCLTSVGCFLTYKTRAQCFPACCAVGRLGQSTAVHSSPQLSQWAGQGWEVVTQCVLQAVEAEDTNRFLSRFANFQALRFHSQWFLFFLQQQLVGEVWFGEASPLDFYWGRFLLVRDGSWRNYSLMSDSHQSGQTTRWLSCSQVPLSLYSILLFPLLEVGDSLWSL